MNGVVIHPFASLNSNYRFSTAAGFEPSPAESRRGEFAAFLNAERLPLARGLGEEPQVAVRLSKDPAPGLSPFEPLSAEPPSAEPPTVEFRGSVLRFAEVPEFAKWPAGPYRQAPAEFGAEWWYVNPFTGEEPWINQSAALNAEEEAEIPEDFLAVFGEKPADRTEAPIWEQNLKYFKQSGVPEGFTQEQIDAAAPVFEAWGLGRPVFYEGRYGWKARFPEAGIKGFEAFPFASLTAPHLVIARYQVRQLQSGETPIERHPFTPPILFGEQHA